MIQYKIDVMNTLKSIGLSSYKLRKDKIFGEATMSKFRSGVVVYGDALNKLCQLLNCQPGDILEYIPDEPAAPLDQEPTQQK